MPDPIIHNFTEEPSREKLPAPPLPISHSPTDPAAESTRQAAFDSAFAWNGADLHPFSSSRDSLFSQHRLAIGAPPLGDCLGDGDAFTADAHRILWLCSHTPQDWSILRSSPAALQCAIDTWADVHIPVDQSTAAGILAMKIYMAARATQHEAAPIKTPHGDDSGN